MQHPLIPLILKTYSKHFDSLTVQYSERDENINEPFISMQGRKPAKAFGGETIYCLTLTIKELEYEIVNREGLEPFLLGKLAALFNTKDLKGYFKIS